MRRTCLSIVLLVVACAPRRSPVGGDLSFGSPEAADLATPSTRDAAVEPRDAFVEPRDALVAAADIAVAPADLATASGCSCVPPTPAGWFTVGWLGGEGVCPFGFVPPAHAVYDDTQLSAAPASCSCACGAVHGGCSTNVECGFCQDGATNVFVTPGCTYANVMTPNVVNRCSATPVVAAGSCDAAGAVAVKPPVAWPSLRACVPSTATGCANGNSCVPTLAGSRGFCIASAYYSGLGCPTGFHGAAGGIYGDGTVDDTRGCAVGDCRCGAATGVSCACGNSGHCLVSIYAGQCGFSGPTVGNITPDGSCQSVNWDVSSQTGYFDLNATFDGSGGSCDASGSAAAVGNVTPSGRWLVCCAG